MNTTNYLDSPRLIASKVNEDTFLTNIEGNKSMNMTLFLNTTNTMVSPVIDGQRKNVILTSNRVNKAISNYATDNRVKTMNHDMIKLDLLISHSLNLKPDEDRISRADGKNDARRD